jgi:hypothetical protein
MYQPTQLIGHVTPLLAAWLVLVGLEIKSSRYPKQMFTFARALGGSQAHRFSKLLWGNRINATNHVFVCASSIGTVCLVAGTVWTPSYRSSCRCESAPKNPGQVGSGGFAEVAKYENAMQQIIDVEIHSISDAEGGMHHIHELWRRVMQDCGVVDVSNKLSKSEHRKLKYDPNEVRCLAMEIPIDRLGRSPFARCFSIDTIAQKFDHDGSSTLSWFEFTTILMVRMHADQRMTRLQLAKLMYCFLDQDGDGYITKTEFVSWFVCMWHFGLVPNETISGFHEVGETGLATSKGKHSNHHLGHGASAACMVKLVEHAGRSFDEAASNGELKFSAFMNIALRLRYSALGPLVKIVQEAILAGL